MKVDPQSIHPELWSSDEGGSARMLLVCSRRYGYGKPPLGSPATVSSIDLQVPVAISLSLPDDFAFPDGWLGSPIPISPAFKGFELLFKQALSGTWFRSKLEGKEPDGPRQLLVGISNKCASIALAEAYRGIQSAIVDLGTMEMRVKTNVKAQLVDYNGGTAMRNITTCMLWDRMNSDGVPVAQRSEILSGLGWKGRALTEYAKKVGL